MTVRLVAIAIDAVEPTALARFSARALRWDLHDLGDHAELTPTDATTFHLLFRPGGSAKTGQNRIHFDLTTTSPGHQTDTVAELLASGARHVDVGQGPDETHVVLADPEGNELCVIEPANRFLAGCPRLGAVNCDGTRALGHFYSRALGWPLVWDQDEETAIQAPDGTGPKITWSGPPLLPRPSRERFHLHLAPFPGVSRDEAVEELVALGAVLAPVVDACRGAIALADVDGNHLCLVDR
jgi:catechol 2,3-dioxygenase-like lactoylglutathione lyase family enzyme